MNKRIWKIHTHPGEKKRNLMNTINKTKRKTWQMFMSIMPMRKSRKEQTDQIEQFNITYERKYAVRLQFEMMYHFQTGLY